MHIHVSLADRSGSNLFADIKGELFLPVLERNRRSSKDDGRLHVGLRSDTEFLAEICSQQLCSNRSDVGPQQSQRGNKGPGGRSKQPTPEHRSAGVDANPYLVAATVLAGMHLGIEEKLKPDEELAAYGSHTNHHIPRDWWSSIESAEQSAFLKAALGERMLTVFLALRKAEFEKFELTVTAEEYAYYGNTI